MEEALREIELSSVQILPLLSLALRILAKNGIGTTATFSASDHEAGVVRLEGLVGVW